MNPKNFDIYKQALRATVRSLLKANSNASRSARAQGISDAADFVTIRNLTPKVQSTQEQQLWINGYRDVEGRGAYSQDMSRAYQAGRKAAQTDLSLRKVKS